MKTVTKREFYHAPGILNALQAGQSIIVTDQGKTTFVVTKEGKRPRRTLEALEREAKEICPDEGPSVDFAGFLSKHRQ